MLNVKIHKKIHQFVKSQSNSRLTGTQFISCFGGNFHHQAKLLKTCTIHTHYFGQV